MTGQSGGKGKYLDQDNVNVRHLLESGDEITLALLDLIDRFGYDVINHAKLMDEFFFESGSGPVLSQAEISRRSQVGAKKEWTDYNVLLAWLEVEVHRALAKDARGNARLPVEKLAEMAFRKRARFCVSRGALVANAKTLARLHSKGRALLKGNGQLSERWHNLASEVAASVPRMGFWSVIDERLHGLARERIASRMGKVDQKRLARIYKAK